jgi:hypothetical protein
MKRLGYCVVLAGLFMGLFGANVHAATLTVAWDPSTNATGYIVQYGTRSGVYTTQVDVGLITQVPITTLADNTTYFFSVKAYNAAGLQSTTSAEVSGTTPPPPIVPATNVGFGGNGKASLIFQRDDGLLQAWLLNGTVATGQFFNPMALLDPNWRIVASADFDNDGKPDLLLQHAVTGALYLWYMDGTQLRSTTWLNPTGPLDPNWKVVGVADFNGDGRPDVLFQHRITGMLFAWYMNGASLYSTAMFNPTGPLDPSWRVAGVADFNGDGKPDILFQHATTSQLVIWYMNRTTFASGVLTSPMGPVDTSFKIVGIADLNGDGKADLIFQHAGTGSLAVWYMNGAGIISGTGFSPSGPSDTAWKIVAIR